MGRPQDVVREVADHGVAVDLTALTMPAEPDPTMQETFRHAGPLHRATASASSAANRRRKTAPATASAATGRHQGAALMNAAHVASVALRALALRAIAVRPTKHATVLHVTSAADLRRQRATASASNDASHLPKMVREMEGAIAPMGRQGAARKTAVRIANAAPMAQAMMSAAAAVATMALTNLRVASAVGLRRDVTAVVTVARRRPQRLKQTALARLTIRLRRTRQPD